MPTVLNDHYLNPSQFVPGPNFYPGYAANSMNTPGFYNQPNRYPPYNQNNNPSNSNPYMNQFSTTHRPHFNHQFSHSANIQPHYPHSHSTPPQYPIYQNPYQAVSPIAIANPNFSHKKKTSSNTNKKKNKNKVDIPETDSAWFQDFLDKRKTSNLEVTSRRPAKKASDEDDDDSVFDDYFR